MGYFDYAEKLENVLLLVQKKATGTPEQLAKQIGVSERTARRMINHLKQKGVKITYSRMRQSYILN